MKKQKLPGINEEGITDKKLEKEGEFEIMEGEKEEEEKDEKDEIKNDVI